MGFKVKGKKEFRDLSRHIKEDASYNVSIAEAIVSETGFTNKQLEQLAALLAPIEHRLEKVEQRLMNVEKDIVEIKQRLSVIESLPTIQRELKLQKSS